MCRGRKGRRVAAVFDGDVHIERGGEIAPGAKLDVGIDYLRAAG